MKKKMSRLAALIKKGRFCQVFVHPYEDKSWRAMHRRSYRTVW